MAAADFWDNQEQAQQIVHRRKAIIGIVEPLAQLASGIEDFEAMLEMAAEDETFAGELPTEFSRLDELVESLELKTLLSGPHDSCGAILAINARDGGTDANDWAEMLLRMYSAWAQKNDYKVELLDRNDNEEAGINSAIDRHPRTLRLRIFQGRDGHASSGTNQPLQLRRQAANQLRRRGCLA